MWLKPAKNEHMWYLFQWRDTPKPKPHQDKGEEDIELYYDLYEAMPYEEIAFLTYPIDKLERSISEDKKHNKGPAKKLLEVLDWLPAEEVPPDSLWDNKDIKRVHEPVEFFKNGNAKKSIYRLEWQGLWIERAELRRRASVILSYWWTLKTTHGRHWDHLLKNDLNYRWDWLLAPCNSDRPPAQDRRKNRLAWFNNEFIDEQLCKKILKKTFVRVSDTEEDL